LTSKRNLVDQGPNRADNRHAQDHAHGGQPAEKGLLHTGGICRYANTVIIIFLACYFFFMPLVLMVYYLADPALKNDAVPKFALHLHRRLTPKYEKWARQRVVSKKAEKLDVEDIAGTEWPLFGSAFYLWATESLQRQWEKNEDLSPTAPNVYAAGAIEAAAALVTDPGHAAWVKEHWGQNYLHEENVFYRMLLISAAASYQKLLAGDKYLPLLRDQAETFSKELDESPHGLLDDYPWQCYPTDVVAAIAAIRSADEVLGTNHTDFVKRSIRGFQGRLVDSTGLPPYAANSVTGNIGIARGCSSQWVVLWAPQLWPETARQWYLDFEEHFWQERYQAVGFREFPRSMAEMDWHMDVDAGPVIAGFGASASAFGLGAARANGRFDHAYPLSAQLIVLSWPLPHGTLFVPRILSNAADAPYLGEASILFTLTRMPAEGLEIRTGGKLPGIVYVAVMLYFAIGVLVTLAALARFRRWRRRTPRQGVPLAQIQLVIWMILVATGISVSVGHSLSVGLLLILLAQFLPRGATITEPATNK
jgi:hypothetical protein